MHTSVMAARQEPVAAVPTASRRACRGFTLIEVLAALVIVALGMLAAIDAVNMSARNGIYLRDKTLAHWIALNVITERRLQESPPDVAESEGRVDFAGEQWRWHMNVTQTQVQTMRRMDVTVRRESQPDDAVLASLSGFYGTAVGAAGGGTLNWVGSGAPGTGGQQDTNGPNEDGQNQNGQHPNPKPPTKIPGMPPDMEE
jgi:general secretion pathway protein I